MRAETVSLILIGLLDVGMMVAIVLAVLRFFRPAPVVQPRLFHDPPPPEPPVPQLRVDPQFAEVDLLTRIGQVVSDGMDRVDAMRAFGADRFLTFMPMPDGTCWSLSVIHYPSEAAAKAVHRPAPLVTR